jgi:hypothetical protein
VILQPRCTFCGERGSLDAHHVTGRAAPERPYADSALTIAVCRPCHAHLHAAVTAAGLGWPPDGESLITHRLERAALHCALVADTGRPLLLTPSSCRGLAALLLEARPA